MSQKCSPVLSQVLSPAPRAHLSCLRKVVIAIIKSLISVNFTTFHFPSSTNKIMINLVQMTAGKPTLKCLQQQIRANYEFVCIFYFCQQPVVKRQETITTGKCRVQFVITIRTQTKLWKISSPGFVFSKILCQNQTKFWKEALQFLILFVFFLEARLRLGSRRRSL